MKKLALLGLICGMGFLVAQEPAPKDQPPVKSPPAKGEGKRPFGGEKGGRGPLSFKKLLETNDKDKDGLLSKEELSGRNMWDRWQKADVNMDGKLDEKEFNDYQKKIMDRFKGGKRGEEKKKD